MATPSTIMKVVYGIPLYPNEVFAEVEPELFTELAEHQLIGLASTARGGSAMWVGAVVFEFADKDGVVPAETILLNADPDTKRAAETHRVELLDILRTGTKKGAGGKYVTEMMARQSPEHVRRLREALETAPMRTMALFDQA